MERVTFVIGDIHGHINRLEALLVQEELLGDCAQCNATGDVDGEFCTKCDGTAYARTDKPVDVVLLGDLGHFGTTGSPTGDLLTWQFATDWADVILWGNHDRAMVDSGHAFRDFHRYPMEAFTFFDKARDANKLKLAHAAHGYLMTHAGLHFSFRDNHVSDEIKSNPAKFAEWINEVEHPDAGGSVDQFGIRDSISRTRGGRQHAGGILWRDIDEKLYDGFPQVFGHSADHGHHAVRFCGKYAHTRNRDVALASMMTDKLSYCVDVGGKGDKPGDNCLAGVYLPSGEIARVDL